MAKNVLDIGPLEMQIIGVLNHGGEKSVADLQSDLKAAGNVLAYTTVLTVLVRLHAKGLVARRKESRYYLYTATKRKDSTSNKLFEKVKKSLFGSERLKPILSLLDGNEQLSREELEELKKAIELRLRRK